MMSQPALKANVIKGRTCRYTPDEAFQMIARYFLSVASEKIIT